MLYILKAIFEDNSQCHYKRMVCSEEEGYVKMEEELELRILSYLLDGENSGLSMLEIARRVSYVKAIDTL